MKIDGCVLLMMLLRWLMMMKVYDVGGGCVVWLWSFCIVMEVWW
jgi:hypothetical protein